ncbi:MAG: TrkH family potassium uptake protein [Spirochaetota bacterium]
MQRIERFIKPLDFGVVAGNLLLILRLVGFTFVPPLIVALIAGEFDVAIAFGSCGTVSFLVGQFIRQKKALSIASAREHASKESLAVVALSYLVTALVSAVPFMLVGAPHDAVFESMSGITTTGLSMFRPEDLPLSLVFFRSYLQWIGGVGIVILSVLVLIGPGMNSYRLYASEFGDEKIAGSVSATARIVTTTYVVLTAVGFLAFLVSGLSAFDSLIHVMSTVSTGGFSSGASNMGQYPMGAPHAVGGVLMIAGAIGFPAYYALRQRRFGSFFGDAQFLTLLIVLVVTASLLFLTQGMELSRLPDDVFHLVSAATTTGFSTSDLGELDDGRKALMSVLMFIGGSAGSTAGGLKVLRLLVLIKTVRWFLLRHLLPDEARISVHVGATVIDDRQLREVLAVLACTLILSVSATIAFTLSGHPFVDSVFDTISSLHTVGLSAGVVSTENPVWQKVMVTALMWAGRIELIPLLVLGYPAIYYGSRRSS